MSFRKNSDEKSGLDEVIDAVQDLLLKGDPTTTEFAKATEQLDSLYKIKAHDKPDRVSKDALLAVIANLAGIGLILSYEHAHVVTSKALSFVMKARV